MHACIDYKIDLRVCVCVCVARVCVRYLILSIGWLRKGKRKEVGEGGDGGRMGFSLSLLAFMDRWMDGWECYR